MVSQNLYDYCDMHRGDKMTNKDWGGNKRTTYAQLGASNHCSHERQNGDFYATDSIAIDKLKAVHNIPKIL